MTTRRVIYISAISSGSKFRLVANRAAAAAEKKAAGVRWASCQINITNGNFQYAGRWHSDPMVTEQGYTRVISPTFGVMQVSQVKTASFLPPCPPQYNYSFPFTLPNPIKQGWKNTNLFLNYTPPGPRKGKGK